MKSLNSLEAYYVVGGQNEDFEDDDNGYSVSYTFRREMAGEEEFFARHPEFKKPE